MSDKTFASLANSILPDDPDASLAYYRSKLPNTLDDEIGRVCDSYKQAQPEQRLQIAMSLSATQASWLGTYGYRMAMLSVRQESESVLQQGLLAWLMASKKKDWRESVMSTAPLYRSAVLIGPGETAFREAAAFAPDDEAKTLLLGFLKRADDDKRLEAMGWRELNGENGIIYVYGTLPVPEGLL